MKEMLNLKHKIGQGMTSLEFMESMKVRVMELSGITNTKEQLAFNYENFVWADSEDQAFYRSLTENNDLYCLLLATDWCPDVIWNVPVLFRLLEQAQIPTEVLIMDDHLDTMDHFLTDGGRAQPIAVILKTSGEVLGRWGARPAYIQSVMDRFKANNLDKQAADYQENLNETYRQIGTLYRSGTEYQGVMIQELKALFVTIVNERQ